MHVTYPVPKMIMSFICSGKNKRGYILITQDISPLPKIHTHKHHTHKTSLLVCDLYVCMHACINKCSCVKKKTELARLNGHRDIAEFLAQVRISSLSLSRSLALSLALSLARSLSLSVSLARALSLSLTHTHKHTIYTYAIHTHTHTQTLSIYT